MGAWKPLLNKRFGKLLVIEDFRDDSQPSGKKHWCKCMCDCGNTISIRASELSRKHKLSCGCRHSNTHGLLHSRFYGIFSHIKSRCTNPNDDRYKDYGGRGIKCLWESFEEFYYDMYDSYIEHFNANNGDTSIDRIDVNGDYCKFNCRWLTNKEQQANKQGTIGIEVNGKLLSFKEYCKCYELPYDRIRYAAKKKNINVLQELYEGGWLNA